MVESDLAQHSAIGIAIAGILAAVYKVWQILKQDRNTENLGDAERDFREEMRKDSATLRSLIKELVAENKRCNDDMAAVKSRLTWLEDCFGKCIKMRPDTCPLLTVIGPEQFNDLGPKNDRRHGVGRRISDNVENVETPA